MAMRQDAWTEQDDLTLTQIVLDSIRNGNSQLAGFEEASVRLNRTAAACGFRWNSDVRKRYENEIAEAKTMRRQHKKLKLFVGDEEVTPEKELAVVSSKYKVEQSENQQPVTDYIEQIVVATKGLRNQFAHMTERIKSLSEELQQARREIDSLKEKVASEKPEAALNEDYQALIQILQRAKGLGVLSKLSS